MIYLLYARKLKFEQKENAKNLASLVWWPAGVAFTVLTLWWVRRLRSAVVETRCT